ERPEGVGMRWARGRVYSGVCTVRTVEGFSLGGFDETWIMHSLLLVEMSISSIVPLAIGAAGCSRCCWTTGIAVKWVRLTSYELQETINHLMILITNDLKFLDLNIGFSAAANSSVEHVSRGLVLWLLKQRLAFRRKCGYIAALKSRSNGEGSFEDLKFLERMA
ncbi:hypothetical protein Tco_0382534, partial [Tanacetum coccineum]